MGNKTAIFALDDNTSGGDKFRHRCTIFVARRIEPLMRSNLLEQIYNCKRMLRRPSYLEDLHFAITPCLPLRTSAELILEGALIPIVACL